MVWTSVQLNESSHLKVRLKGHVTLPHFRDIDIIIDVILGVIVLGHLYRLFSLQLNGGISYFLI
jgi:hypothetical protein